MTFRTFRAFFDPSSLTPREAALLDALLEHGTISKAAAAIGITATSASKRMESIRGKLCVNSTKDAVGAWRARKMQAA
jgi:molybdenum-dependent DNA-binding transcriptional regulator ModE